MFPQDPAEGDLRSFCFCITMIYLPVSLLIFLSLLLLLPFICMAVVVDLLEVAVAKLGSAPNVALVLLALVIIGSRINIHVYRTQSSMEVAHHFVDLWLRTFYFGEFPYVKSTAQLL